MDTLYIHAKNITGDDVQVDLDTLLVLNVFMLCDIGNVKLHVVLKDDLDLVEPILFGSTIENLDFKVESVEDVQEIVTYVKLPALLHHNKQCVSLVAGLCSVARHLIKSSGDEQSQYLLGFRESCLAACSESSIWTKFCEVDMVATVKQVLSQLQAGKLSQEDVSFPDDLIRFEYHMKQPVRMHNVYNIARKKLEYKSIDSSVPVSELNIPHCYSEGPYMTLSDIILLPLVQLLYWCFSQAVFAQYLPLVTRWLGRMENYKYSWKLNSFTCSIVESMSFRNSPPNTVIYNRDIKQQSLYASDPSRYKPTNRIYTKQNNIENALGLVYTSEISLKTSQNPYGHEVAFDWSTIPMLLRPEGGAVPKKRSKRKEEQLENLAKAVIKITRLFANDPNQKCLTIVDFCSGSGHLGLLLAYMLPHCRVILVENKEKSLERALERIEQLAMSNLIVLQSNLDYFKASFDIGVALHACGVATDLVMQNCIENNAHFVCCPCCYGGIHDCYHMKFPRSRTFIEGVKIEVEDYLNIAHAADQTHDSENAKTAQGYKCMDVIDTDRKLYAESCGYSVDLGKLYPDTCTPKNNLLVGLLTSRIQSHTEQ